MPDFEHLRGYDSELAELFGLAEKYASSDPTGSLAKTRILAELIATEIGTHHKTPRGNSETAKEFLDRLAQEGYLPKRPAWLFDQIRIAGNTAIHDNLGSSAEALLALEQAHELSHWFCKKYPRPVSNLPSNVPRLMGTGAQSAKKIEKAATGRAKKTVADELAQKIREGKYVEPPDPPRIIPEGIAIPWKPIGLVAALLVLLVSIPLAYGEYQDRLAAAEQAERQRAEQQEADRLRAEQLEAQRQEAEQQRLRTEQREEAQRQYAEKQEAQRRLAEQQEAERLRAEQREEAQRQYEEEQEAERRRAEQLEVERWRAEQQEKAQRRYAEEQEAERQRTEQQEADRLRDEQNEEAQRRWAEKNEETQRQWVENNEKTQRRWAEKNEDAQRRYAEEQEEAQQQYAEAQEEAKRLYAEQQADGQWREKPIQLGGLVLGTYREQSWHELDADARALAQQKISDYSLIMEQTFRARPLDVFKLSMVIFKENNEHIISFDAEKCLIDTDPTRHGFIGLTNYSEYSLECSAIEPDQTLVRLAVNRYSPDMRSRTGIRLKHSQPNDTKKLAQKFMEKLIEHLGP